MRIAQQLYQARNNRIRQLQINYDIAYQKYSEEMIELILNSDVQQLKILLKENKVSSEDLVLIFAKRVATIGLDLNLITDINFEEALKLARECDQKRKINPQECKGELFGIPISVKDTFEQQNLASTYGCIQLRNNIFKEDGQTVSILKMAGAIPFVKSNIPQSCMTYESFNNLFQRAQNPWDRSRAVGGSSGGEGGLIAARCSPLGIGSDIAGSIRIPASFCGVYGFKPSCKRISYKGHAKQHIIEDGMQEIPCSIGPIGKSVEDLADICRIIFKQEYFDQVPQNKKDFYFQPKNFDETIYKNGNGPFKYTIGYYKSLKYFEACESSQRAVEEAKVILEKQGHTLVEIVLPQIDKVVSTFYRVFGSYYLDLFNQFFLDKGEPIIKEYQQSYLILALGANIRKLACFLMKKMGQERAANCMASLKKCSALDCRINISEIQQIKEMYQYFWDQNHLDAIISPGFPVPPVKHSSSKDLGNDCSIYTFLYNLLDYSSGVLPVTKVLDNEQHYKNCKHQDIFTPIAAENMINSQGLPVSVQVTTLPYQEEKCLFIMNQIDKETQFYKKNKFPLVEPDVKN